MMIIALIGCGINDHLMLTALLLWATAFALTTPAQADAMIYYVQSASHEFALEWYCRTGNEEAVRNRTAANLSAKVTPHQLGLLMAEFDRNLSRFGYETKASKMERDEARTEINAPCDLKLLADLKANDLKNLSYIDSPNKMREQ